MISRGVVHHRPSKTGRGRKYSCIVDIIKWGDEEYEDYPEYQVVSMLDILFNDDTDSIIAEIDRIGISCCVLGKWFVVESIRRWCASSRCLMGYLAEKDETKGMLFEKTHSRHDKNT